MQDKSSSAIRRSAPFLIVIALIATVILATTTQAASRLSVTLVYFRGESQDSAARLEWRTATEDNTAGFKLERGPSANGPFTSLDDVGFIEARGTISSGDTYEARDETVSAGQTYWYRLIEVEFDNSEAAVDMVEVSIAGPTPTAEPIGGGGDSGSTPSAPPTSTSAPTNTPQPTQANSGGNSAATATQASGSAATPTATVTGQSATTPDGNNNRPTNTPPPSPTRMTFDQSANEAEAAEPPSVAQVTPANGDDGYPGPGGTGGIDTPTVDNRSPADESYPGPAEVQIEEQPPETVTSEASAYPGGAPIGSGGGDEDAGQRIVGAGDTAETAGDSAQQAQESALGRAVLWIGFAFALLIFAGGAIFAIVLSTRKQDDTLA
ncbi:MAG TPA: hypothetical protein VK879_10800 [Candidatus Sulfomarinibacteraceae bacterium]|nr:hypothetical protein [Candidatus Sulfomarinibacteraceae bacterium]